jgi:F0F1-type ATP synthase epsilon subunit
MKNSFSLTISLPAQHLLTFEAKRVRIPAIDGYMGIMASRQPLIAALGPGLINIIDISDEEFWLATTGGFCEMLENEAVLLCDSLLKPSDVKKLVDEPLEPIYHKDTSKMNESMKIEYVTKLLVKKLKELKKESEEE